LLVERAVSSVRSPSPLALAWRKSGAGQISARLRSLFASGDPLVAAFCAVLDRVPDDVAARATGRDEAHA
jgi:LysR family transcriptional regulator, transcriptional activator of the allD operon